MNDPFESLKPTLDEVVDAKERISAALVRGSSPESLSSIFNLPADSIENIKTTEEYKTAASKREMLNQGWDSLEALSLSYIIEHIKTDPDPDYALTAAKIANAAKRHGVVADMVRNINPQNGRTVTLSLTARYTTQKRDREPAIFDVPSPKKDENTLDIESAESLLASNPFDDAILS